MSQKVETCKVLQAELGLVEEELTRTVRQQMVAADLSSQALRGWELDRLMDAAVRLTADALSIEFCNIFKLEQSGDSLRLVAGVGWRPGMVGSATVNTGSESLAGQTLIKGVPILVEDYSSDERFSDPFLVEDHDVASSISVPMVSGRFVFGVMGAHSTKPGDFSQSDVHFLETMANIVTISVLRGQAVEALGQVNKGLIVARRHIEKMMEVSPDAIVSTNGEGSIVLWNQVATNLLGYEKDEIVGKKISAIYEGEEQAEEVMRLIRENGETLTGFECILKARDGSEVPVSISASLYHDETDQEAGIVYVFRDMRERKEWEEELNKVKKELASTSQHLSRLMDIAPDVILATDAEGFVTLCNNGAGSVLGYPKEDIVGQHISVLFESQEQADEVLRRVRDRGDTVSGLEIALKAKDGSPIPVLVSSSPFSILDGQETGAVWWKKDLRERMKWEEELGKANAGLKKARDTIHKVQASALAAEKLAALGRLTAGVSHEILNPLNIVTLRLHMMIRNPDIPPEIVRHLKVLDEQASRIAKITEDLLYFARQREPERSKISLNDTVRRTLGLLEYDLRKNNVDVVLGLEEKMPSILADQGQLQQVILNLLTNARDAMPKGGRLELTTSKVQSNGHDFIELRVSDTGKGIDPKYFDQLFEPFFTTKAEGEGTGLGLSICQGIVASHGGSICAESELDRGTTFIIQLPVENESDNG